MSDYSAPGVYIEEFRSRPRVIEGSAMSTAAFVGPTLLRPEDPTPLPVTSFAEFEQRFGGSGTLPIGATGTPAYVAHAARAFFAEGGRRLYVAPVAIPADGRPLAADDYLGEQGEGGLAALESCDDIELIAAPGASADPVAGAEVMQGLIRHVERRGDRFAVLDAPPGRSVEDMWASRQEAGAVESSRAALYYPWVVADDPRHDFLRWRFLRRRRITLPPSGFVCGIYARVDGTRGVHAAPAGEAVHSARALEQVIGDEQQSLLNPRGINCLRFFPGRGHLVWGARTLSQDPEYQYVNVRRYLIYLERSIDRGTRWAVFEPNAEPLWATVRQAVEAFLFNEFRTGALQGAQPGQAYFVRCDRSTMTQSDVEAGRLICLVGVALLRPAEFVILRIRQQVTAADGPA